jgi:hypothetical protein
MDIFIEQIVNKKSDSGDKVKKFGIIFLSVIAFLFATILLLLPGFITIVLFLYAGIIFGAYYWINLFNVEFEYIITNDEMDIDKIVSRKKRTRLLTVDIKKIEGFTEYNPRNITKSKNIKFIDASGGDNGEFKQYCIDYSTRKSGKIQIVISPEERTLKSIKTYLPRNITRDV